MPFSPNKKSNSSFPVLNILLRPPKLKRDNMVAIHGRAGTSRQAVKVWLCGGQLDLFLPTTTDQMPVEVQKTTDGGILQRGYVREDASWFLVPLCLSSLGLMCQSTTQLTDLNSDFSLEARSQRLRCHKIGSFCGLGGTVHSKPLYLA